ncbi:MAG: putative Ig domain-containing protein, partial [Actinomycetes bacterium]
DLPDGVKFTPGTGASANTGTITGQVRAAGVYEFTITASNAEGVITSQTFTLRVDDAPPTDATTATVGVGTP